MEASYPNDRSDDFKRGINAEDKTEDRRIRMISIRKNKRKQRLEARRGRLLYTSPGNKPLTTEKEREEEKRRMLQIANQMVNEFLKQPVGSPRLVQCTNYLRDLVASDFEPHYDLFRRNPDVVKKLINLLRLKGEEHAAVTRPAITVVANLCLDHKVPVQTEDGWVTTVARFLIGNGVVELMFETALHHPDSEYRKIASKAIAWLVSGPASFAGIMRKKGMMKFCSSFMQKALEQKDENLLEMEFQYLWWIVQAFVLRSDYNIAVDPKAHKVLWDICVSGFKKREHVSVIEDCVIGIQDLVRSSVFFRHLFLKDQELIKRFMQVFQNGVTFGLIRNAILNTISELIYRDTADAKETNDYHLSKGALAIFKPFSPFQSLLPALNDKDNRVRTSFVDMIGHSMAITVDVIPRLQELGILDSIINLREENASLKTVCMMTICDLVLSISCFKAQKYRHLLNKKHFGIINEALQVQYEPACQDAAIQCILVCIKAFPDTKSLWLEMPGFVDSIENISISNIQSSYGDNRRNKAVQNLLDTLEKHCGNSEFENFASNEKFDF